LKRAVEAGFNIREVCADKGYLARDNYDAAAELDIDAIIPFQSNSTGQSKGSSMYHKMFLYFQYNRDKFDQHYGQRAQVETTFGAIKQKLGETLLSRNFTAQVNELVAKLVAYNTTVLIRQMFERDLLPDFLRPPQKPPAVIQPVQMDPILPNLSLNHGGGLAPGVQSVYPEK
jgi:Transposase DDE domain